MRLRSCFVVRFGFSAAVVRVLSLPQLSPLCLVVCCVVSGHLSTQTRRYRLTGRRVWWSVLFSRACAVPQQARPAPSPRSPLATVRRRGLVVRCCPSCSLRAALSELFQLCRRRLQRLLRAPPLLKVLCVLSSSLLRIVLHERLTSKMAVRHCLLMLQLARNLRH